jgi:hypothetical protein
MAQNRTNASYGAVFVDESVVQKPTSELPADKFNRLAEDVAQMTRTSTKGDLKFSTTTTAAVVAVSVTFGQSQWGTGSGQYPTISKTATGTYVITYPTTYDDALIGTAAALVAETEAVSLDVARGSIMSSSAKGYVICTSAANVVTAYVYNTSDALSDLGGSVPIWIEVK